MIAKKRKKKLKNEFENGSSNRKRKSSAKNEYIGTLTYKWSQKARSKHLPHLDLNYTKIIKMDFKDPVDG